ncbi:cation diffusion facilitator family transporter [Aurantimonas sp. MSK8Z-1]|uniref:cation diffusion facilitator family transporter n=1 Tax=Mangrovibrevibacter kandeliae TaxID=2968473 RepID=UPI0021185233|nr:cation diffusion facilitator family transporter [Aurantimonas sp. MSK8Z-1]MCW4114540.1 cation diffusion facilitator family transporter [Aurantimonas sp. MSK8Z-1]
MRQTGGSHGGGTAVYAAMGANLGIAVTKFGAALFTGSSSMLAEGIHSMVDTANQGFLLLGIHRAKRAPTAEHPFGYGVEIYFWSFVVAILIFALGAGFSIYEGVEHLMSQEEGEITSPLIGLGVLGVSFLLEGYSWSVAFREFQSTRAGKSLWQDFRDMKDPSVFVVLFEDTAACLGILIAAAGLGLAWFTGNVQLDAAASIVIGLLLAVTAVFLAIETKGLLIGEAASPEMVEAIRSRVAARPEILGVNEIRTMHRGPADVLLTMSVDFADGVLSQDIERAVSEIEARVKERFPIVKRLYIEVQSREGHRRFADREAAETAAEASA